MRGKRQRIIDAAEEGKVILGICGGFQLLVNITNSIGSEIECVGALILDLQL